MSATELPTTFTFTGQREAAETGLMYYVARWYDSEIGHFIQADTIVPDQAIPLSFNRFAYVKYNPLNLIDPSGHDDGDEEKPKTKKDLVEEWLTNPCTRDLHFCMLNSGGLVDNSHYNSSEAERLVDFLLRGYEGNSIIDYYTFTQAGFGFVFEKEFGVDFSKIDSYEMLYQVGGGIWLRAQQSFELLQSVIPPGLGLVTSFSLPDISSTYLAYMGAARGKSYDEVIELLGGGSGFDFEITFFYTVFGPRNTSSNIISVIDESIIKYPNELNIDPLHNPAIWWSTDDQRFRLTKFD